MLKFYRNKKQSGQALKKKLAGLFFFSSCIFILLSIFSLYGCGGDKSASSFAEQLSLIDACIQNNQFQDAISLLDKAAEDALGLENQLSIIKRYTKLGEREKNKQFVVQALKNQPEVPELNAVYANILLAEGNVLEAVAHTDKLASTKWSPLYTEVILRRAVADNMYMEGDFTDFFIRAARATQNEQWLVDAAVVESRRGNYQRAASMTPDLPSSEKNAYFWALVNYDAGKYLECVDLCGRCGSIPEAAMLASDAWLMAGENKAADDYWLSIINGAAETEKASDSAGKKASVPKEIYSNAALYAVRTDDLEDAYSILVDMVTYYPDYDDGLALYADYALKTSGSMITATSSSLSTLQQRKKYSIPSIPVSDALYRIEKSLEKDFRAPLYVEYLRTQWLSGGADPISCRQDILYALEKYSFDNKREPYLTDFAVCWMLRNYHENEASGLFYDYMVDKYGFPASSFVDNMTLLTDRECLLAAWFRLDEGFVDEAQKLYETYIFDRACLHDTVAAMNLGAIYNATGSYSKALDLYGSLAGSTDDSELASEIHYRMGYIQASRKDKKNALLSLSYSVKLNPDNNKARLLLKTLQ